MTDRPADEVRLLEIAQHAFDGRLQKDGETMLDCIERTEKEMADFRKVVTPEATLTLLSRLTALRAERDEYRQAAQVEAQRVNELTAERDAANARAMPLPEAPKDEREALLILLRRKVFTEIGANILADAILAAGWRRTP